MLAKEPALAARMRAVLRRLIETVGLRSDEARSRLAELEHLIQESADRQGIDPSASISPSSVRCRSILARRQSMAEQRASEPRNSRVSTAMPDLLRPKDLKQMASEAELAEMEEERLLKKKKQQQELDLREAVHDARGPSRGVRSHQSSRQHRRQARRAPDPGCDVSLHASAPTAGGGSTSPIRSGRARSQGFAKNAYDFFDKELRPLGYKLHAEIISFPGGMPGEVGTVPEVVSSSRRIVRVERTGAMTKKAVVSQIARARQVRAAHRGDARTCGRSRPPSPIPVTRPRCAARSRRPRRE